MSASLHIDKLFTDFFENAKEIGRVEEQHKQAILNRDFPTMVEAKFKFSELYYQHYTIKREIHEAYKIKERSKTRFQRLFNR